MKITICGSLRFEKEMKKIRDELENKGHQILMPQSVVEGQSKEYSRLLKEKNLKQFIEFVGGRIKLHHSKINSSEAILVLNYDKNGKKNYIGANTFLEMGFAFVQGKKIFTINPLPDDDKHDEMISMNPCCINNDLKIIK